MIFLLLTNICFACVSARRQSLSQNMSQVSYEQGFVWVLLLQMENSEFMHVRSPTPASFPFNLRSFIKHVKLSVVILLHVNSAVEAQQWTRAGY